MLSHASSHEALSSQSDASGNLMFDNIPDGLYQITGTALEHSGARAIVTVVGPTRAQLILSLQPVQVRCSGHCFLL